MDNFKWVKGNTLPIAVSLQEIVYIQGSQAAPQPYIPPQGSIVKACCVGKILKYEYPCSYEGNIVTFVDDGRLPVGTYGIEIIVNEVGRNLRSFKVGQIQIVNSSDDMELGDLPVVDGTIQLDAETFYWAKGDKGDKGITTLSTSLLFRQHYLN